MDEVTQLRDRVGKLEAELAELRALVERVRPGGYLSIRASRRCPACGGGAFLHVPRATQASHTRVVELGLTHVWKWTGVVPRGVLEAFACRGCGLVEWRVADFSDVDVDGEKVIAVEPEGDPPRDGPFR